jgi:TonB family protein
MRMRNSKRQRSRQAILVALLLSVLLHQVVLTGLGTIFDFSEKPPEKPHEVVLLEEPKKAPEPPEEKKPPEKKAEPKKKVELKVPEQVAKPTPVKPAPPTPPAPKIPTPTPPVPETVPETSAVPVGPVAEGPEPEPDAKPTPPKLDLSWRSFEKIFGAKAVEDRETYAKESLERRRGQGAFHNYSARVMRALKNNHSFVPPGRQEVLGKERQQIFHNYIEAIHEASVHPLFADSFLRSLPSLSPSDPLNNWDLHMVAEFEIFENGQISEIRVIKTSGNMVFDAGAVDSIYRSSPFPPPPKAVLSWNRRVYLRWGFYRNNRKCGVFNVEPYILKAPGANEEPLPVDRFTIDDG